MAYAPALLQLTNALREEAGAEGSPEGAKAKHESAKIVVTENGAGKGAVHACGAKARKVTKPAVGGA